MVGKIVGVGGGGVWLWEERHIGGLEVSEMISAFSFEGDCGGGGGGSGCR